MVILYEASPEEIDFGNIEDLGKRLYKITGLNKHSVSYARIVLRYHQEARKEEDIKEDSGSYKNGEDYRAAIVMLHTQFHALVEGEDFEINALGEITLKH